MVNGIRGARHGRGYCERQVQRRKWKDDGLFIIRFRQNTAVQNGVKRVSLKAGEKESQKEKTCTQENVNFPAAT